MKLLTVASLRGAPGVTTTALLLAGTFTDAVVVEADLDGGVLAVRYSLGREPGLTTFAASGGDAGSSWRTHAQDAGGIPVLVGPDAPSAAASLWTTAGERITDQLIAADGVAVIDAGRLRALTPVVARSDVLAVLVSPVAEQLVALTHRLATLQQSIRGAVGVVLAGNGPYGAADLESSLDIPVLGDLPDDRNTAEALRVGTGPRARPARSRLARAVTELGAQMSAVIAEPSEVVPS